LIRVIHVEIKILLPLAAERTFQDRKPLLMSRPYFAEYREIGPGTARLCRF
jgi:hypothetical protein